MWISSLIWALTLLIVVTYFSKDIKNLISAITIKSKIRMGNVYLELGGSDQEKIENSLNNSKIDYHKSFESPVVRNKELAFKKELIDSNLSPNDAVDILIYHLANTQVNNTMLIIDRLIFPQQINLLLYLNSKYVLISKSELTQFYDAWKIRNKVNEPSVEKFLEFLTNQGLIENKQDTYIITPLGKDYLSFRVKSGLQLPA